MRFIRFKRFNREEEKDGQMGLEEQEQLVAEINGEGFQVPSDCEPLEFLMAVMRDHRQPMSRRMRAAEAAAQYRHAKLTATALMTSDDFGTLLDKAIERSNGARVIEHHQTETENRE
jgi:hypothetical protein